MKLFRIIQAASLMISVSCLAHGADWPHWRGPMYNGSSSAQGLPSTIDLAQDVVWSTPMPGKSSATPIVSGDAVFAVSNDDAQGKVLGLCLDRATGAIRWTKVLGEADANSRNDAASSSPVTDGTTVYFMSRTGGLFAFDFAGNELWHKDLLGDYGPIDQQFGFSSSPLLHEGRIYLPLLRGQWESGAPQASFTDKDSFLLCLDAATGAEVWKHHRPTDARGESLDSYASMVPFQSGGADAVLVQGGDYLSAHLRSDGTELWRHAHNESQRMNWRLIPSPVAVGELAIGIVPRGGELFAVLPGEKQRLAFDEAHWILDGASSDVPCPAVYDGKMYIIKGTKGDVMCVEPQTGKLLWEGDLDVSARVWGSPTVADGKLYCLDEKGQLTIASVGEELRVLSKVEFDSTFCKSTIAVTDGQLFVRTSENLYCLGASKQ